MSLPLSIAAYIKKRPKRIPQNVQRQTKRNECTAEENFHLKNVIRKIVIHGEKLDFESSSPKKSRRSLLLRLK